MRSRRVAAPCVGLVLAALGTSGCHVYRAHSGPESCTESALLGNEGEIKGVLTQVGGPAVASPQAVLGKVDVYTRKGDQVCDVSPVSAWDFELKPGTYTVSATANGITCGPVTAKVVTATIQVIPLVCPIK